VSKSIKWLMYGTVTIIAVCSIYILTLFTLLDPNQYRPEVEQQLSQLLGRTVNINGSMSWRFYPVLGITINQITVANDSQFQASHMARFKRVHVGLKSWPLLIKQQYHFQNIFAYQGVLHLHIDKHGHNNWESIKQQFQNNGDSDAHQSSSHQQKIAKHFPSINHFALSNMTVIWQDKRTKRHFRFSRIDFDLHSFHYEAPFHGRLAFKMQSSEHPALQGSLSVHIVPQPKKNQHLIKQFKAHVQYEHHPLSINAQGNLTLTSLFHHPQAKGQLTLNTQPQAIAKLYQIPRLKPLGNKLKLTTEFKINAQSIHCSKLNAQFEDNQLTGQFTYILPPKPSLNIQVDLDKLDINKYTTKHAKHQNDSEQNIAHPPYWLTQMPITGKLHIDRVMSPINLDDLTIHYHHYNNHYKLTHVAADMFNGTLTGHVALHYVGHEWRIKGTATARKLDLAMLIDQYSNNSWLEGHIYTTMHFSTRGRTYQDLIRYFHGRGGLALLNGRLKNYQIHNKVKQALHHIDLHQYAKRLPEKQHTQYKKITITYELRANQLHNRQVHVKADELVLKGSGTLHIGNRSIKYRITAAPDFLPGLKIPLVITGQYNNPDIDINFDKLVKIYILDIKQGVIDVGQDIESAISHVIPF